MNDKDAKHMAEYIKNDLKLLREQIDFMLYRMEQAEEKYGLNKQKKKNGFYGNNLDQSKKRQSTEKDDHL